MIRMKWLKVAALLVIPILLWPAFATSGPIFREDSLADAALFSKWGVSTLKS